MTDDTPEIANIEKQIKSIRNNLLDLTMRNRLLNFNLKGAKIVKITNKNPRDMYNILVLQEKKMEFSSSKHESNGLQTELDIDVLKKKLKTISRDAKSALEEQGFTILYLALGFLEWTESSDSVQPKLAPLILVPVELEHTKFDVSFRISWTGEDISTNISLKEKLLGQGIILPNFEMVDSEQCIGTYFEQVNKATSSMPKWRVTNDIYLGFFSFTKFVIYKDLDSTSLATCPLTRAIFDPDSAMQQTSEFSEDEVDEKLKSFGLYHVMDADPSQIAVIEDIKAGNNLVVEGPPGTGKSQTITNIIAEFLSRGKTVLFVSEKMAALEVVKSRLDSVGLGDFCLELHSRKSNKKEVLKELERTLLKSSSIISDQLATDEDYNKLDDIKCELNNYAKMLREPLKNIGWSPFDLFCIKEDAVNHFIKHNRSMIPIKFLNVEKCKQTDYETATQVLQDMMTILPLVKPVTKNPWIGCYPSMILPSDESEIYILINECRDTIVEINAAIDKLIDVCEVRRPTSPKDVPDIVSAARILARSECNDRNILTNAEWNELRETTKSLIQNIEKIQEQFLVIKSKFKEDILKKDLEKIQEQFLVIKSKFKEDILKKDVDYLHKEYKELSSKSFIMRIFSNRRYNNVKNEIFSVYNNLPNESKIITDLQELIAFKNEIFSTYHNIPKESKIITDLQELIAFKNEIFSIYENIPNGSNIVTDLQELIAFKNLRKEIQESDQSGRLLFGSYWKGDKSDPQILYSFSEWIVSFRRQLLGKNFDEHTIDKICTGISCEKVDNAIENVNSTITHFKERRDLLTRLIDANCQEIFGEHIDNVTFDNYSSRLELWKAGLVKLRNWTRFVNVRNLCLDTVAGPIINAVDSDKMHQDDIVNCFSGNFADMLLRHTFIERPALANFSGDLHDKKIENFAKLDKELIMKNRQRLADKLYQNHPHLIGGASRNSEVGILLGEFHRKRGHMPIRKLITSTGRLIQKIKPCFMMSPISIAQFLNQDSIRFDLVVFDEASQVKSEDALGAILRGYQVVVIGDTKQMPPTNFFDNITEPDDEEEQETIAPISDTESILRLCKIHFPSKMLRWHYRSRHDSLIAVSNHQFYDNRLVTYPSAINSAENVGLKMIHIPNTVYDRGKSGVNRIEARSVAKAAFEHCVNHPDKSIGIGTFNIKQQRAIEDEIDLLIRDNPEIGEFFNRKRREYCFVKNLETIQGDERDVILISIGFGFDENKRLSLNFGPLNKDGGERRLNVLITRAREQCIVFSNFKAQDLKLESSSSFGLRSLKVFLDFAENRNLNIIESEREDTDSPFEDSVKEFLTDHGYDVHSQIGCTGYRIDLAIVSPKFPGRYVLGIECDGAMYHSSKVARDRDRLRQQVLEGLGWKLYRIWSTDWYRNRSYTQNILLETVKQRLLDAEKEIKKNELDTVKKPPFVQHTKDDTNKNSTIVQHPPLISEDDAEDTDKNSTIVQHPQLISDDDTEDTDRNCAIVQRPQLISEDHEEYAEKNVEHNSFDQIVPRYEICTSLQEYGQDIDNVPEGVLARDIVDIVEIEGPVHIDEIVRRIRSYQGLKRSGNKISSTIRYVAELVACKNYIVRREDFYWPKNCDIAKVRYRCDNPPAKIELICNEEIAEAVKLVLKYQFATMPEDLVIQSSRVLGFRSTSEETSYRIKKVIDELYHQGQLNILSNNMIDLRTNGYIDKESITKNIFHYDTEENDRYSQAVIHNISWIKEQIYTFPDRTIRVKVKDIASAFGLIDQSENNIYRGLKHALLKEGIIVDIGEHKSGEKLLIMSIN